MATIPIDTVKAELSRLVDQVMAGEEVIIVREGKPVAQLVPFGPAKGQRRVLGRLAGQFTVPDNFDAPLPDDIVDLFDGR